MKTLTFWTQVILLALLVTGCRQDDILELNNEEALAEQATAPQARIAEGVIPFTIENVKKALPAVLDYYRKNRPEVAKRFADYKVTTTHLYYKFNPQDSLQYARLMEADETLQLTNDRFEYTPKERTDDPKEDEIPEFYAIAEAGYRVPDVPREVIAELHFTDEDKLEDIPVNYDEVEFKQNLMYETRKIAGHLDDEELKEGYINYREGFEKDAKSENGAVATRGLFGKKWRPTGTVHVEDDWLSERRNAQVNLPVYRAEVNVLKWGYLRIDKGSTNQSGYFSTGTTYTKNVHYNVKFTDFYKVKVRPGNFFAIANWKSGNHKRRPLQVTFVRNTVHQFYALINNAAWDYFDRVVPAYGVYNPGSIEISGHYNDHKSNYWFGWIPFRSEVKIGGKYKDGSRKRSDAVYATVIHEITHKGHYKMDSQAFNSIAGSGAKHKKFLRESWAECVETIATNDKYRLYFNQYGLGNYVSSPLWTWEDNLIRTWNGNRQYTTIANMNEYSSLMIDLMDHYNQRSWSSTLPDDRVQGYTLQQIQTALNNSHTVNAFFDKLRLLYFNSTENNLQPIQDYANTIVNDL